MNPKEKAAQYAFEKIEKKFHKDFILGIGTGSTTNCFIEILKEKKPENIIDIVICFGQHKWYTV